MDPVLSLIEARINASLDIAAHEADPVAAVVAIERHLREARNALSASRASSLLQRRRGEKEVFLTFEAGALVPPNPWPPAEPLKGDAQ